MKRARRTREDAPRAKDDGFQHSSRHVDLESLLAEHMLDPENAAATAEWLPSRRGNSAHEG
jgi:hypothetical protein